MDTFDIVLAVLSVATPLMVMRVIWLSCTPKNTRPKASEEIALYITGWVVLFLIGLIAVGISIRYGRIDWTTQPQKTETK